MIVFQHLLRRNVGIIVGMLLFMLRISSVSAVYGSMNSALPSGFSLPDSAMPTEQPDSITAVTSGMISFRMIVALQRVVSHHKGVNMRIMR